MIRKISLLLAVFLILIGLQLGAESNTELKEIRIAIDNNYPPYFFLTKSGKYQGILYDIWKLWESKTGIKVIFIGVDWNEAIKLVDSGQAQVLETAFSTDERRLKYEFSAPYTDIKVPIFCRKDLTDIKKNEDLQSYVIGVKDGDAVIDFLKACNVTGIRKYKSYQDVINAAINNEIHIFSVDEPPALYYLDKLNYGKEFRLAFMLYTGRFHCAVLKENAELLSIIKGGFEKISAKEKE
ncbi:MAG TPA: transporter substrate-binding domain-containing protein [Candidatus Cloacimonadota bacterium]|nr:transporter substrate-binding domain-containing protein [Candidatus Cloacimonadota bacterium]HQB41625.1 transporter substrate-binding domain-containing protein [Candidatus Cloacimonadota bacterium]